MCYIHLNFAVIMVNYNTNDLHVRLDVSRPPHIYVYIRYPKIVEPVLPRLHIKFCRLRLYTYTYA